MLCRFSGAAPRAEIFSSNHCFLAIDTKSAFGMGPRPCVIGRPETYPYVWACSTREETPTGSKGDLEQATDRIVATGAGAGLLEVPRSTYIRGGYHPQALDKVATSGRTPKFLTDPDLRTGSKAHRATAIRLAIRNLFYDQECSDVGEVHALAMELVSTKTLTTASRHLRLLGSFNSVSCSDGVLEEVPALLREHLVQLGGGVDQHVGRPELQAKIHDLAHSDRRTAARYRAPE